VKYIIASLFPNFFVPHPFYHTYFRVVFILYKEVIIISQLLKLVSPIPPSVNHYLAPRPYIIYVNKKPKAMVSMYETTEAKEYKKQFSEYVQQEVQMQNWDMELTRNKHYYLDCIFYFERIDQDEQNYFKCLCDSMNGIVYIDDNYILTRTNAVYYDNKNPRIELVIYPVEYIGIFPTQEHLEEFEIRCEKCKRYKNNCSILRKAKEGRIQEEITDLMCRKFKD
jgi:crossover junction endodeoxyribonuclease RusA